MTGRTALVTGAARGIGLAIAARLVRDGARVAMVDRDAAPLEAAAAAIGAGALAVVADVTSTTDIERAVRTPWERWGRLDVVVNNAGITGLASDECSFSTGAVYDLSGGRATY